MIAKINSTKYFYFFYKNIFFLYLSMFPEILKSAVIKIYNDMKNKFNINGEERIKFIEDTFKCDITSVYIWKK